MNTNQTAVQPRPEACPECGRPLPSDSPHRLCARCLIARAVSGPASLADHRQQIGGYQILDEIAQGGMGVVYRAHDPRLNRTVALKMIGAGRLATGVEIERFKVEAEAAARLEHPGIVSIYEIGEVEGRHFFTMRFVPGGSLGAAIAGKPIEPRRAAELAAKVARAVHFAHQRGVLHRDIKPNNILLNSDGEPLLTDFGLARIADQEQKLTRSLTVMGSASYMAPEQAQGQTKQLTTAADIYSLGTVLYEMLTGRPPFAGETLLDTLRQVLEQDPVRPSQLNPGVDRDLETICLKCLEKAPSHRYPSAEELGLDLERWLRCEPVAALPPTPIDRALKWARRKPAQAALTMVALAAALAFVGLRIYHGAQLKERVRILLIEQARAERLLHHRDVSLRLLGEAAALRRGLDLRSAAIQAITQPGVSQAFDVPFGSFVQTGFSPDGALFAAGGDVPSWKDGKVVTSKAVRVWKVPEGTVLWQDSWNPENGPFAFSPDSRSLAVPQGDTTIALFDPRSGRPTGTVAGPGVALFSPAGHRLAISGLTGVRVFDARNGHLEGHRQGAAAALAFSSETTLLLDVRPIPGSRDLRRWNVTAGGEIPILPPGALLGLSANGRVVASLESGPTHQPAELLLTDIETREVFGRIPLSENQGDGLLSPDGHRMAFAAAGEAGRYLIWDVPTGRSITGLGEPGIQLSTSFDLQSSDNSSSPNLGNHSSSVSRGRRMSNNFSWNSVFLAGESSFGERNLHIWELNSGTKIVTIPRGGRPVWSSDDRWLAVEHDGEVLMQTNDYFFKQSGRVRAQVWAMTPGVPTYRLQHEIQSLSFSADGRHLAAENTLWAVEQRQNQVLLQRMAAVNLEEVVRFASNNVWAVAGGPFRNSATMRFRALGPLTNNNGPRESGFGLSHAFAPDGQRVLVACAREREATQTNLTASSSYQLWDLKSGQRLAVWPHPPLPSPLESFEHSGPLVFSPDGRLAAGACFTSSGIEIWDVTLGQLIHFLPPPGESPAATPRVLGKVHSDLSQSAVARAEWYVSQIAFTPDNQLVAYATAQQVTVRKVKSGHIQTRIRGDGWSVTAMALSPDGNTLATGGDDRVVRLWVIRTGEQLAYWEGHESAVSSLAFSPDGTVLASGSREGMFKLWHLPLIRRELALLGLNW